MKSQSGDVWWLFSAGPTERRCDDFEAVEEGLLRMFPKPPADLVVVAITYYSSPFGVFSYIIIVTPIRSRRVIRSIRRCLE